MAMIRDQIMQIAESDPRFAQAVEAMERAVVNMPIVPEDLDDAIEFLEQIVLDPPRYAEIRQQAIREDVIDEDTLPAEFDPVYIVSLLVALYGLQDRLESEGYARGGLSVAARKLADMGRNGDTELAHITRGEAAMLRRAGGSGTINPNTGLREYFKLKKLKLGKILAAVAPVALSFIAPGIGTAIGGAISSSLGLGLGATGAGILGSAAIGAATGALGGGAKGALTGAVTGGLGAGLGGELGQLAGLTGPMANIAGSSLIGAGLAGATGRNPLSGALRGAVGAGVGALTGGLGTQATEAGNAGLGRGLTAAGTGFGTALAGGMDPRAAAIAGGLSGLAAGMIAPRPSQAVVENLSGEVPLATPVQQPDGTMAPAPGSRGVMPDGRPGIYQADPATGMINLRPVPGSYVYNEQANRMEFRPQQQQPGVMDAIRTAVGMPAATPTATAGGQPTTGGAQQGGGLGSLLSGNMAPLLAGGALLLGQQGGGSSGTPQVVTTSRTLTPQQQEYLNRPSVTWDWNRMQRDAAANGMSLDQFIATNWNRVSAGEYNAQNMAQGGLSVVSRFVRGGGTGRSDEINAKLSDGEYVIDAETVAMLGDGSSKAGAQRLDKMRESIRQHKGKTLAKGKFSPNAKSPLTYLKGVA
jgi:hypothetical protein